MSTYSAVLDANVLYSALIRDIMMRLALTNLFKARWTDDISREWIESLVADGHDRENLERTRELMERNAHDVKVEGYRHLIDTVELPYPNDRHVLAAAIRANADAIVTFNLKDFPETVLSDWAIEAIHPDDFILYQIDLDPGLSCSAFKRLRKTKHKPPVSIDDMLAHLRRCQLPQTAQRLEQYRELI